ncbi:hypothetical protein FQK02_23440 [Xanthomonas vasicola]|uniref:Uncharacterized protein n=1 Tax=Xanthomonas vasicola pv. vasculorum NCPPB 890 TaxID=1184265 RepID=A0A836ZSK5_XANVA|nr:hypothetical protein [Xanthomonas vasicola]MEB1776527.1 hypothetical protein [Xanthomonas campestris pv. campestris]KFA27746.1 hypothetical protein KW5_0111330 [Xanthomonas vasicola pv. vasculorum NCPPB 1326]KFA34099.1 hypothetical protein KWG_0104220 [Xanthomonas vasicola pv. vasculorum NCPPB 1381]MBV6748565.1 hypothetical protein [Xanthomonas vasicola pv. vasculorum NCPPB 890]MBV6894196.1 hypothetical protein [Xanthomonas vasicola pv. vasculorum]
MSIKANIFQPAKAIDLKNGTLFTLEEQWYVRGQLYNEQRQLLESAIPITPGAEHFDLNGTPCLALASPYSFECRVIGPIRGPGLPVPASITWSVTSEVVYTRPGINQFMTFAGGQSKEVNTRETFFASHWGVWVLDAAGNQVGDAPLFVVNAEASKDAGTP